MPERGELLDTLNVKLERAARANDLGVVCDDDTQQEVLQLLEIVEDDDADVAAHYTLGWVIYCWYQVIGEQEQNPYLEVAIRMFTPCFAAGDPGLPDELLPALAERALPAASALLERARDALDQDQASEAVDLWQRITDALPVDHPERSACRRAARAAGPCAYSSARTGRVRGSER